MFCSPQRGSEHETSHRPLSARPWEASAAWVLGGLTERTISDTQPKNESEIPAVLEVVGLQRLV